MSRGSTLRTASLAGAGAWVLYVLTASAGVGWYDAPELTAAAQQLGVAHPPGEPSYLLIARLAQMLPLGDLSMRVVWLSAAVAAAVVVAAVWLATRLLPDGAPPSAQLGIATLAAVGAPLWIQGALAELYGLQALLVLVALVAAVAGGRRAGGLALAGLALGLAWGVNPLLTALSAPGAAALVALSPRRPRGAALAWGLAGAAAGFVGGASTHLLLPLRSAAAPGVWFAELDSVDALVAFVSGRAYARSFTSPTTLELGASLGRHVGLVAGWLGPPGALAALAGSALWFRRRWRTAVPLALVGVGPWLATLPRVELETHTPDVAGYLLPSFLLGVWLVGAALAWGGRRSPAATSFVTALVVGWAAVHGVGAVARHRSIDAETVARALLEAPPPGGMLITGSDSTSLPVLHAACVRRARPDVLAISLYSAHPGSLARGAARHPWLALPDEALASGIAPEPRLRALLAAGAAYGAVGTPLLWPPERVATTVPAGLALGIAGPALDDARLARLDRQLVEPLWQPRALQTDRQLRRLLGWRAATWAHVALRQGDAAAAGQALRHASALHPDPWAMVHLQRHAVEDGRLAPPAAPPPGGDAAAGRARLIAGDTAGALPLLERGVATHPGDPDLWEDLGTARLWERDLAGAAAAWDEALRLRPGSPGALAGKERLYSLGIP